MTSSIGNKDLFASVEFSTWIEIEHIFAEEKYMIQKYLQPHLKTVEAGTNGGRILLNMKEMGFTALAGFDNVPELIEAAIARNPERDIDFQVQDAVKLSYPDDSFDQILYLQQILCLLESEDRLKAMQESLRILKPGGIGLFSFLNFESRSSQFPFSIYIAYLKALRKLRGNALSIQYLPWIVLGGKFNFESTLLDRSPHVYWYRISEAYAELKSVGFKIVGIGTIPQILAGDLKTTDRELLTEQTSGTLYIAVQKP
ncbi:class I SAM-dependent methyltransferase [Chamaesiphon minutus]|uniref:Methylase involved in ubiquinone/menaquinone biosynthesis n=1 Tax=Chamaesiphon minutus (strain ATCC 27169 / PCC 6605) TaxID=1173020 RepID=K9U8G2_CHAP6|nr:class I SAM-dependent methyltransferase [Chamaesiphon minutus]AFY91352.1 methylase involved in ubiquinone/menaquinone biosynthesis [Chamaesiphon minutus PCC 6605]